MQRRIYPPTFQLPFESELDRTSIEQQIEDMNVSDEQLTQYNEAYFKAFRSTVDEFFPQFAKVLTLYAGQPFHTTIVRLGKNGVIVVHKRSATALTDVRPMAEFARADGTSNIFDVTAELQAEHCWFNATPCQYSAEDAHARAVGDVLSGMLEFFWQIIPSGEVLEEICQKLIEAEGIQIESDGHNGGTTARVQLDLVGQVVLQEPGGFRRLENWGFEVKHHSAGRVSAAVLHELENAVVELEFPDVICLITDDDLTSVGRYLSVESTRIRVWDRVVLNRLVNHHLDVLRDYFEEYPSAVEELSRRLTQKPSELQGRGEDFSKRLQACPFGKKDSANFENIGTEIITYLFGEQLGPPRCQARTIDEKQRRDVLFRNARSSPFFERLFHRFNADSLIVDFKNYGNEIASGVITDVDKYANKALGRFILVVSRKGVASSATETQIRVYRDSNTIVLVISDDDMVEMVRRKDSNQPPEDVLEDKLDDLLARY